MPDHKSVTLKNKPNERLSARVPLARIVLREGCLRWEKDTTITRVPTVPKAPTLTGPPARTMSMDKAKKLIRKASEHAGLFRRLAK
jgi:hypothetical protein